MNIEHLASLTVWGVSALAALAIAARAVRVPAARSVWIPTAAGALAVGAGHLPAAFGSPTGSRLVISGLVLVGVTLLVLAFTALMALHHHMALLRTRLDVIAAVLLVDALLIAAVAGPVQRASGLAAATVTVLLMTVGGTAICTVSAAAGLAVAGGTRTARGQLFLGALLVLTAAETAGLLERVGVMGPATQVGVHEAGVALSLVLLAASAWVPVPPLVLADEPTHAMMVGTVAQLTSIFTLLAVDHVVGLRDVAVVLAVCAGALQLVCIVLIYRVLMSLSGSRRQAHTDELTGLGNRRALSAALARVGAERHLSLILLDLDRFKEVNDVLGHDAGDDLLQQVGARLLAGAGPHEVVVRQGGDEFALVRSRCTIPTASVRAEEVVAALQAPFTLGPHQVSIEASIGIAVSPEHSRDAEELFRMADSAMQRAKARGGGVLVYDAATDAARQAELQLLTDLREAVAKDRLCVHFQPQLEAATGALVGVEALVRWQHPTRGMLAPFFFLPLAEKHGLMDAITRQVLDQALAVKRMIDGGTGSRMSVNISATSLLDPRLVTTVGTLLQEHAVPPAELMLEITETELMLDTTVSRRVVCELVALGVGVSIDDYGTGHSSLAYLKDLPASELKLDRSFVAELRTDPRIATIVRSTVELAHSLGLELVAEGVEDQETLEELVALGVDVTQGYHHSRPVPAEELARWAAERRVAAPAV